MMPMSGAKARAHVGFMAVALWTLAVHAAPLERTGAWQAPPILFEQAAEGYRALTGNLTVQLTRDGAAINSNSVSLRMRLAGARRVTPSAADASPVRVNYLKGNASQWRTNVPASDRIVYAGVYPGIDLVFHGRGKQLEYDFELAAHADPASIQIQWSGARKLSVTQNGNLVISTETGSLEWLAPNVYQNIGGVRRPVEGEFKLLGSNRVSFRLGSYDPAAKLVIDPAVVFSTYLAGSRFQIARGVATDSSGNVYVAGGSDSIDLMTTKGAYQTGYGGGSSAIVSGDAFVAKYSPSGTLIFLTYLGGTGDDTAMGIAVDSSGNSYVTGSTNSTDFPVTAGAFQSKFGGFTESDVSFPQGDAFISKLSADGSTLSYSTYLGGTGDDMALGIAIDSSGNAYVAGTTQSRRFPVTPSAYQTTYSGEAGQAIFPCCGSMFLGGDAFVTKLNPTGTALVYSTFLGGADDDVAATIAVDNKGSVTIGGYTISPDFPTTQGAFQTKFGGREPQNEFFNLGDGFIARFDPTGSNLVFSTFIGGQGDDWVSAILVDSSGNVFATGGTTSMDFPATSGAFQAKYQGPITLPFFVDQLLGDAFLLQLDSSGASLDFATYIGGSGDDNAMAMAFDPSGNIVLAGFTNSSNFPVPGSLQKLTGPAYTQDTNTFGDAFLVQFSAAGKQLYGTFLGGSGNDVGLGVAVTSTGVAAVVGSTASIDFPVLNAAQPKNPAQITEGTGAAFVTSISGLGGGPNITSVHNAGGETSIIAPNTWIEIKGSNLAPDTRQWQGSDFVNGQMPTQLDGVVVTVDGKPAFVSYISSAQVNVLTPIDSTTGAVQVQIKNNQGTSAPFSVQAQSMVPSFFEFGAGPYVAATHGDGTYLGPATLGAGFTPAKAGEEVVLYGNGFGATNPPVINGSETQSGNLPVNPTITIGGAGAQVVFAGVISPGLYQFNVIVPSGLPSGGGASLTATLNGQSTQNGVLLQIQ